MLDQSEPTPHQHALQAVDRDVLTPLVRRTLDSDSCDVIDWTYTPIHGGGGDRGAGLSGIYRFSGNGLEDEQPVAWSLILKIIGSPAQGGDPQGGTREWQIYQSGVLNDLAGSLIAPRCFNVVEQTAGVHWLWMEEIVGQAGSEWSLDQYGLVARHLGQFNGTYFMNGSTPDWPWMSQDWLRTLIAPNARAFAQLPSVLDHPLVRRQFPADVAAGLLQLWTEREMFLEALNQLPQSFCHRDAWSRNLFLRRDNSGQPQTVAIDWAFTGLAALGEEIVPLVQTRNYFDPAEADILDARVFESYLSGLRDAGWDGNPDIVRFAYAASSALRYGLGFVAIGLDRLLNYDDSKALFVKRVLGDYSIEEVADLFANVYRSLLKLADEARTLFNGLCVLRSRHPE